jgi:hypothetical protein
MASKAPRTEVIEKTILRRPATGMIEECEMVFREMYVIESSVEVDLSQTGARRRCREAVRLAECCRCIYWEGQGERAYRMDRKVSSTLWRGGSIDNRFAMRQCTA